ncbi:hypothetical protein [Pseudidiomarina marina]|uniref:hypothetical protein n=1 Tax=Pseudidiomarina marina TaxID=502366 RepID=UPI0013009CE4|nr:hypothetical protein [Pseudidiomarina marina]
MKFSNFITNSPNTLQQLTQLVQESNVDNWDGDGANAIDVNLVPEIYSVLKKAI